jgi:hypothetical protein
MIILLERSNKSTKEEEKEEGRATEEKGIKAMP